MRYREFGKTGLKTSEIAFGGGFVGGVLIRADDETKLAVVRRALAAGINWIDTAPAYGVGASEAALGWILREVEAAPHLSTKVMLDTAHLDDIPGEVEDSLAGSLRRLRRESVDLVQLHNPIGAAAGKGQVSVDLVLGEGGVADALERVRDQGLTRHIGITGLGEADAIRTVIASGRFDSAQVYYNLINPSAARALPSGWSGHDFSGVLAACADQGIAVMAIRVLAAGVLATEARHGREIVLTKGSEMEAEERRARVVWDALGEDHGTRAQAAVRFALARPEVSCAVVGLAEPDHLEQALAAAEMGPLPADALARLDALYDAEFGRL